MNRLQQKRLEVNQRYAMREWLSKSPSSLADILSEQAFIAGTLLGDYYPSWPVPNETEAGFADFDAWEAVQAHCATLLFSAPEAKLFLGNHLPYFIVSADIWRAIQADLLASYQQRHISFIGVVADDHSQGLVIDEYLGYLPEGRRTNNHELVYQVAAWGLVSH